MLGHTTYPHIDLTPIWTLVEAVADVYEARRRHLATSQLWRGQQSTHLVGIAGQVGVALITGQPTNVAFLDAGDGGHDTPTGVDIKTATYWPPILKHPANAKRWPQAFGLAHLSQHHIVTFCGFVTADELRDRGYQRTFNPNAGPQLCLNHDQLRLAQEGTLAR